MIPRKYKVCHFRDKFMETTEISAFFLTFFAIAGVKILHLDKNTILSDDNKKFCE